MSKTTCAKLYLSDPNGMLFVKRIFHSAKSSIEHFRNVCVFAVRKCEFFGYYVGGISAGSRIADTFKQKKR